MPLEVKPSWADISEEAFDLFFEQPGGDAAGASSSPSADIVDEAIGENMGIVSGWEIEDIDASADEGEQHLRPEGRPDHPGPEAVLTAPGNSEDEGEGEEEGWQQPLANAARKKLGKKQRQQRKTRMQQDGAALLATTVPTAWPSMSEEDLACMRRSTTLMLSMRELAAADRREWEAVSSWLKVASDMRGEGGGLQLPPLVPSVLGTSSSSSM